ncbi:MFS transporter [Gemmata obscuriglobus]|uniref:MFS transporter n=2 Tax=Gemmata obscuriglobus TaxID=114 RepID=A0A2Z3HAE6_9BACT|nr:MFS transporter [Gemmata obscuriglobus]
MSPLVRWLVLIVAAIGFLFDTYELLMFPVIGAQAVAELLHVEQTSDAVRQWGGRMLWIAALAGGVFGLLGGFMVDRFGRKTVMVGSILVYSLSPVAAAYSTELWHLVLFRCTTFIGVCVEAVAAVAWLAELFEDKRQRERAIGWTLAFASLGGILVTEVFNEIVADLKAHPEGLPWLNKVGIAPAAWRYTLLTGLVPGALILLFMPFVPESRVWKARKAAGTLKRPSLGELFSPELRRTTIVTTVLSACGYAAAFGALQLGPLVMAAGLPAVNEVRKETPDRVKAATAELKGTKADTPEHAAANAKLAAAKSAVPTVINEKRGEMQRWQEVGGLLGRILFAVLVVYVSSRMLIRSFLLPGLVLFPLTYLVLYQGNFVLFSIAVFFCGLMTVAQFSYVSEYLPKVFPLHLRGTGSAFATNVGGRMFGTMAATLNTEFLSTLFLQGEGPEKNPLRVATAAAIIGAAVYAVALIASFMLPEPKDETPATAEPKPPASPEATAPEQKIA